ncbi:acyl-CoA reductase [Flavobacteriaceae bacterium TP-CH-4]|uniref:Acyl-CoA reductase n=1 Tax=Pelagihabitans pacificus TaxID=2696054 RepID=A0A967AZ36_9FLAO|nr:acyl-CoA reductase [Pelagihabitans pacificus]NHF60207.1 acyl-CoA reductase [Pelagihabitans pacificus]
MGGQPETFSAFVKLGGFLRDFCNGTSGEAPWVEKLTNAVTQAKHQNGWFTEDNVLFALNSWGNLLTEEALGGWLSRYKLLQDPYPGEEKTVALIMAGNIPLVGFHDFLSILLTGNRVLAKLSSNDTVLISFIRDYLVSLEPIIQSKVVLVKGTLQDYDAVIATGSNNTARYFEYYFGKGPNIIRKNRNSAAVLTGKETKEQLAGLGEDIFRYYGLGCRSVSKLFVPDGYDFDLFFQALYPFHAIIDQAKYANNYDYNKAVYLMSDFQLLDNGFLILKEDTGYASPIASLFYEHYKDLSSLKSRLQNDRDQLQCVVSEGVVENEVAFGQTQSPALSDYADGVDTVDFLLKI